MMLWFVMWLATCAVAFSLIAGAVHFDVVAVFVLRLLDVPAYAEARMVAATLYRHPGQWTVTSYTMTHPKLGQIRHITSVHGLYLDGPYGQWQPSAIERRIIWNAISWYQRDYIKSLLRDVA